MRFAPRRCGMITWNHPSQQIWPLDWHLPPWDRKDVKITVNTVISHLSQEHDWILRISKNYLILNDLHQQQETVSVNIPGYFTVINIKSSLRHEANTSTGLLWLVCIQVMHVRLFISHLEIPDLTVPLSTYNFPLTIDKYYPHGQSHQGNCFH